MRRMWDRQAGATVRELLDELRADREIAYTTVMTVMDKLYKKGWLRRGSHGRAYRYETVGSREEYSALVMWEALDGSGDRSLALQHFVAQISAQDVSALRAALIESGRCGDPS